MAGLPEGQHTGRVRQPEDTAYPSTGTVVLVEGESDRLAVRALAARTGRDLAAEGVTVVAMGGATNAARYVAELGTRGRGLRLAGLCDAGEARFVRRALAADGQTGPLAAHGFHVCRADLEDELIRALGVPGVEEVVETLGESGRLATFRQQPAQRGRDPVAQLRRFIGTHSGAKAAYATALVEALPEGRAPEPLTRLLAGL